MMKQFTLFIFCLISFSVNAQQKNIQGMVQTKKNEPISDIEIQILTPEMNYLQSVATDSLGRFELNSDLDIIIFHIDTFFYKPISETINVSDLTTPLIFYLEPADEQLSELTISVKRPTIKQKIDRLVFDVENSSISNLNTWEILQRTPNVTVRNGNLEVRNNNNVLVTINDKKWIMTTQELQTLLENTPGEELEAIEVITNPPAQYEASGATIVNIKLKQNKLLGYKGTLYSKYEQSMYAKALFGASTFYNVGKWNFAASYYRGMGNYVRKSNDYVYYEEDETTWNTITNRKDTSNSQNTWNALIGYEKDSLTSFSFGINGFYQPNSHGLYNIPTTITNANNEIISQFYTLNKHNDKNLQLNLYSQFQKKINNHNISSTIQFTDNNNTKFQDILTIKETSTNNFANNEKNSTQVLSIQVDDSYKNDKISWDNGIKFSNINSDFQLLFSDDESGNLAHNPNKSNNFKYTEQNFSAYTSINYNLEKWAFKAGLRAEYTSLKGEVQNPIDINKQSYLQWFPTIYIQRTFENSHQLVLSYGKRINRPYYAWLNPTKSYYNEYSYFQGDPRLKPTLNHNFELNYSFKSAVITPYFRYIKSPAMEINFQNAEDKTIIYRYTNIKDEHSFGIQLFKSFELAPRLSLSLSGNTEHTKQLFWGLDEKIYENKKWTFNGRANVEYQINPKQDWTINASYFYTSGGIQGTFNLSSISSTSLQTTRKFFNKKLDASLVFNDIFYTQKMTVSTRYANQNNYFKDAADTQKVSFVLRFHFGNQKVKSLERADSTDEQNRL